MLWTRVETPIWQPDSYCSRAGWRHDKSKLTSEAELLVCIRDLCNRRLLDPPAKILQEVGCFIRLEDDCPNDGRRLFLILECNP